MLRLPLCSGVTVLALLLARPGFADPLAAGDELAVVATWTLALALAGWLLVTSATCALAHATGHPRRAQRTARLLPGFLRHGIEATLLATLTLGVAPAHALTDAPVVRGPRIASVTTTTDVSSTSEEMPSPPTRPPATTPPTTAPAPPPTTRPSHQPDLPAPRPMPAPNPIPDPAPSRPAARPEIPRSYVVQPGDNLWRIASRTLEQHGRPNRELVAYWHAVIEANASTLRSGDPNLIYPGEIVALPPIDPAA
jgi:nucleoid-associated protein YgaU